MSCNTLNALLTHPTQSHGLPSLALHPHSSWTSWAHLAEFPCMDVGSHDLFPSGSFPITLNLMHIHCHVTCLFLLWFPLCPRVSHAHMFLPHYLVLTCVTLVFLTHIYKSHMSCMFLQFVYQLQLAFYSHST